MAMPKGASSPGGSGAARSGRTGAATKRPTPARAASDPILSIVTRFWSQAPSLTPAKLTAVRNAIARTPAIPPPVSRQVQLPIGRDARTWRVEKNGMNPPRYSPKPAASAAMPPDMMTRKEPQPKRNPASAREHRAHLGVGQRSGERQESSEDPRAQDQYRMRQSPGDVGGRQENRRAEHRADRDESAVPRAQGAPQRSGPVGAAFQIPGSRFQVVPRISPKCSFSHTWNPESGMWNPSSSLEPVVAVVEWRRDGTRASTLGFAGDRPPRDGGARARARVLSACRDGARPDPGAGALEYGRAAQPARSSLVLDRQRRLAGPRSALGLRE